MLPAMPRTNQVHAAIDAPPSAAAVTSPSQIVSLRDFVVDEDAAHFSAALWKTIDQNAFILAQRDALEGFNVAKAMRLSEETAALEQQRRSASAAASPATTAAARVSQPFVPESSSSSGSGQQASSSSGSGFSRSAQPQPASIKKDAIPAASDEAAARSLARSWLVDALQPAILENKPSSSSSSSAKPKQPSASSSSYSAYHHDKKTSVSISKQHSHNLSLSNSSSSSSSSVPIASESSHSRASSSSHSHSNAIPSTSQSQPHRIEHRSLSKRDPGSADAPSTSPPSSSRAAQIYDDVTNSKRRRTEPKPSFSTPSSTATAIPSSVLVAPPISAPIKSTAPAPVPVSASTSASTRDARPGQSAKETSTPTSAPEPSRPRRRSAPQTPEANNDDIFTARRSCANCGVPVVSPRSEAPYTPDAFSMPFCDLLHVTCTGCGTVHCRGCFSIARCALYPPHSHTTSGGKNHSAPCAGGPGCAVRTCCADIRAVAIFEALCSFDATFATEAGFAADGTANAAGTTRSSKEQRQAYVKLLISKADKSMRRFEDALVRTLKIICSWLQEPSSSSVTSVTSSASMSRSSSAASSSSSSASSTNASSSASSLSSSSSTLHPSIPHLLTASYLPEVLHAFLSNTNVRDWIAHAETYLAVLETLRRMWDCGLGEEVLARPVRHVYGAEGLRGAIGGVGGFGTEAGVGVRGSGSGGNGKAGAVDNASSSTPLCELVKQLEKHRGPLMALAAKVQFAGTVEKVNNLCDGISYLLLQQVVGGI